MGVRKPSPAARHHAKLLATAKARCEAAQNIEDLRDDVLSVIKNSGLSYDDIHAQGGACPSTLHKWQERETKRPQLGTIRGTLRACGWDLYVLQSNVVKL